MRDSETDDPAQLQVDFWSIEACEINANMVPSRLFLRWFVTRQLSNECLAVQDLVLGFLSNLASLCFPLTHFNLITLPLSILFGHTKIILTAWTFTVFCVWNVLTLDLHRLFFHIFRLCFTNHLYREALSALLTWRSYSCCLPFCLPPFCPHPLLCPFTLLYFLSCPSAPHSSTLAWKIPWTEEPSRLQSMASWRVGHDWAT